MYLYCIYTDINGTQIGGEPKCPGGALAPNQNRTRENKGKPRSFEFQFRAFLPLPPPRGYVSLNEKKKNSKKFLSY